MPWLVEASTKALPSLLADTRLKELISDMKAAGAADEMEMARKRNFVNEHISQIVIDYLKRTNAKGILVDCESSVEAGRVHCILILETRGRVATRYVELKT